MVLDCNHELAGQNLNFDITLVDVVSETPIEHGVASRRAAMRLRQATGVAFRRRGTDTKS